MLNTQQLKAIYGNEQVLLLLLSRLYFSSVTKSAVEEFIAAHEINWYLLRRITNAHSIGSFIYHTIASHQIDVDSDFETQLKQRYNANRLKNFGQIQAAGNLIAKFKERSITIIPYKGAVFSHAYYGDIALRESSDIDFLISRDDLVAVEDYFIEGNYNPRTTVPRPYLGYYRTFYKDIVYHRPDVALSASIEMHWRLMDRFSGKYPSYDFFSPHLVSHQTGGLHIDRLSPTYDLLAVVSNHFVKDMGIKFKYLIDLACLINKEKSALDVAVIISCAKRYGFEKKLMTGLGLLKEFLDIELIEDNLTVLPEQILKTPLEFPVHLPRLYINEPKFIRRSLQLQDNSLNRLKFILRCFCYGFLPTYEDINQFKLPVYFLPLLIIARPFRLLYQLVKPEKKAVLENGL